MADEETLEQIAQDDTNEGTAQEPQKPDWQSEKDDLVSKLKKQSRKVRQLERAISASEQRHMGELQAQKERLMAELDRRKVKAIKDGNAEEVVKIEREAKDAEKKFSDQSKGQGGNHPAYEAFLEENDWYEEDEDMQAWANGYAAKLKQKDPKISPEELFGKVAERARKTYPDKFKNTAKSKPPAVESAGGAPAHKDTGAPGWESIPKDYRPIFESLWKDGAWTEEKDGKTVKMSKQKAARQYAAGLVEVGAIDT